MNKEKCINLLKENNIDSIILCNEANMHYICNFSPSEGIILITKDKGAYHFVDSRYTEIAINHSKDNGLTVIEIKKRFVDEIKDVLERNNIKSIMFENETISLARYESFKKAFDFAEFIPVGNAIMGMRNQKSADEIVLMKQANAIAEKAFTELLNHIKVGKSEKELAAYFDYLMAKNGSDGVSFDTILLTGTHTSMPHGVPDERTIKKGDFVLFDFGATYKGYHSDMTRTIAVGECSDEMRESYNLVLKAQLAGIKALNVGVPCKDVYQAAWDVLQEKDMAKYFGHGLGHGVGLEIHEGFNASPRSKDIYQVGNVTSIEPGIYLPDKYGIRIEDVLYLSPRGRENLSNITKELIIV